MTLALYVVVAMTAGTPLRCVVNVDAADELDARRIAFAVLRLVGRGGWTIEAVTRPRVRPHGTVSIEDVNGVLVQRTQRDGMRAELGPVSERGTEAVYER